MGARLAQQAKGERDGDVRLLREEFGPAEVAQGGVQRLSRRRSHRLAECLGEQMLFGGVHGYSLPRSSSRRAMMFRWISAVPP